MTPSTRPPVVLASPSSQAVANVIQLQRVTARRFDGRVANIIGKPSTATDPYFFTADDGITYVTKVVTPDRTAFNDAMFSRLARRVELRVPDVVAIDVPAELVADDPQLSAVRYPPGLHVGVARLPNGSFDLRGGALQKLGGNIQIENERELPGSVIYCSWIEDADHLINGGNWMLEPREQNKYIVWIIDFGDALGGFGWDHARLQQLQDPATVQKLGPHAIAARACAVPGCFQESLDRVGAIDQQELADLALGIPQAWQPGPADRVALAACLISRRPGLGPALGATAPGGAP